MAIALRQDTASQEVILGPFLDSTDGNTQETGITIANTDIQLWKNGTTTTVNKNSGGATHISNGRYYCVLDATDTNTVGPLVIFSHPTGALAVRVECVVLPTNIYDSFILANDNIQVDVIQASGSALSATSAQFGANVVQISADSTAADNAESFFDGTGYAGTNNTIPTVTNVGTTGTVTNPVTAGTVSDKTGYSLTITPPTAADVADTVWDELQGSHNVAGSFGSYLDVKVSQASGVTTAAIADAVWEEAKADHTTGTTFGDIAADITTLITDYTTVRAAKLDNLDATITSRHASGAAVASVSGNVDGNVSGSVNSVVSAVTVGTNNDKTGYSLTSAEENTIADKVWDEQQGEHLTASSFGSYLDARVSQATGGALTVGAIADAVWEEAKSEHTTNTTFGDIATDVTTLITDYTTARAVKLDNLDATITSRHASGAAVASVSGSVGSVTDPVTVGTNNDKTGYRLSATGVDDLWDEAQSGHTGDGTFGKYVDAAISGVSTGGVSAADIANAVWDEQQGEHLTPGTTGSYLDARVSQATGGALTVGAIADGVWDEPKSEHVTNTTFGDIATDVTTLVTDYTTARAAKLDNLDGTITSRASASDYTTARAVKLDNLDAAISTIPTAAENADANWDELRSGHTTAGSFGKYLDAQISSISAAAGAGAETVTITVNDGDGDPITDCAVWVTTDLAGTTAPVASATTNAAGQVTLLLDVGTFYVWRQKNGVSFSSNPQTLTVVDA